MKVLQINKYYYEKGGSERTLFLLTDLLESHGVEVIAFSMKDARNLPCKTSSYFVDPVDYKSMFWTEKVKSLFRPFASSEVKEKLRQLIQNEHPDVAHLHNLSFHLTSSVIRVLEEEGVPFVMTLHDYGLIAPNYTMNCNGKACTHLLPQARLQWKAILHRCYDRSFLKTAISALDIWLNRPKFLEAKTWMSPSLFLANRFKEFGWPNGGLKVLPHFIPSQPESVLDRPRDIDILFVGRLTEEKGVRVLFDAIDQLNLPLKVVIVGSGPQGSDVRNRSLNTKCIQWKPHCSYPELTALYSRAKIIVVPSLWFENAPYVLLEAMSYGCVPVASRIGGIPEIVRDQKDGRLFTPGSSKELYTILQELLENDQPLIKYRRSSFQRIKEHYDPKSHFQRLLEIYRSAQDAS